MSNLHVNHEFLLSYAARVRGNVLDYGCGGGEVVVEGLNREISIYGFDTYGAGHSGRRDMVESRLLSGGRIRHSVDGEVPFPDGFFSLVVSNQVFEHVHDLDRALSEIARVLEPGGEVVALFPTREVFREGHIGIPMAHWWPDGSRGRARWIEAGRRLGLGFNKGDKSIREWSSDAATYLDNWTAYRSLATFRAVTSSAFSFSSDEPRYIQFRLAQSRLRPLEFTTRLPGVKWLQTWLLRELMGRVVILRKSESGRT